MTQSLTLKTLCAEWLTYLVGARGFSPHTRTSYDRAVDQFRMSLRAHGREDTPAAFTDGAVLDYMHDMAAEGISPNTIVIRVAALSSFARYLMKRKTTQGRPLLRENPTKQVDWPTMQKTETEYLRPDELRAVLDHQLALQAAVTRDVLIDTGLRASELCRANVGDMLEMADGWVIAVTVKGRGMRRRQIHMPVGHAIADGLRAALLARGIPSKSPAADAEQPLLVNARGKRYNRSSLDYFVMRLGRAAGVTRFRLSPHKFRHTANVLRTEAGIDARMRSKLLGQTDASSQERYDHIVPGSLREAKAVEAEGLRRYLSRGSRINEEQ
jgi:integrase/recombinase XerC